MGGRKKKKKKNRIFARAIGWSLGIIGFIILTVYGGMVYYFQSHFFFRTQLADIDVSGMTAAEAAEEIGEEVADYLFTIYDRNGEKYQIRGVDIAYSYQPTGEELKLIDEQNAYLWPFKIMRDTFLEMEKSITYDEALLKAQIDGLAFFDEAHMIMPTNAHIEMQKDGYALVEETNGSYLLADKVHTLIKANIDIGETELVLPDDVYKKPEVTSEDEVLVRCMEEVNSYFGAEITYEIGFEKEKVDRSVISSWITIDEDYNVFFDESAVSRFVQGLASKYNTYGDVRKFKTSKGDTISIGGGDYGWVIDKEAEKAALLEEIHNGEIKTREPMYSQTAIQHGTNDIGDTYVEIDYTNQYMWYYEKGKLRLESEIVSGNIRKGNGSPDGIFKIVYKKSPAVLKGEDYESDVTYFMPFAYNVGFHDASWRNGKFGGEIYKTSGSHGCINMPIETATKLYELVHTDTPVIAYYRDKVELHAENAKISNAFSYVELNEE